MGRQSKYASCLVDDCFESTTGYGYCSGHYYRYQRYGDPLGGRAIKRRAQSQSDGLSELPGPRTREIAYRAVLEAIEEFESKALKARDEVSEAEAHAVAGALRRGASSWVS